MPTSQKAGKSSPRRTRKDPRRESTRLALIEQAETMFGNDGVDAVSLRQIGVAIGSANDNVVAYHFGDKEALIEAIFKHRVPAIEARRAELFAVAIQSGRDRDLATLIHALMQPFFEQTNALGQHSFAAFLASVSRSTLGRVRLAIDESFPVTREIVTRIRASVPKAALPLYDMRWLILIETTTIALAWIDEQGLSDQRRGELYFADALRMVTSAISAPVE